jgi:hypothetical protein
MWRDARWATCRTHWQAWIPPPPSAAFTAAIKSLRAQSTPYHLAHGLLDYVEYLMAIGGAAAVASAVAEARDIAGRLRCQPLLDRAVALVPPSSVTATPQDSPPVAR